MYKVTLKNGGYGSANIAFEFESYNNATDFVQTCLEHSEEEIDVVISLIEK